MLIGFKKRFIVPIQNGSKVFTIRKKRKVSPKIGETLYMYSGLRTANCSKISEKEKLIRIQHVRIYIERNHPDTLIKIHVDGRPLSWSEIYEFVKYDGFHNIEDFADYWIGSPFKGKLQRAGGSMEMYHWTDLKY